ncbi:MAG: phosphate ABC transporter permease subunit PstC [Alphaproteobacteria bacterium]
MTALTVALVLILAITAIAFVAGRQKSLSTVGGELAELHSLPAHYGSYVLLWCLLPGIALLVLWAVIGPGWIESIIGSRLLAENPDLSVPQLQLLINDIRNQVAGDVVSRDVDAALQVHVDAYASMIGQGQLYTASAAILLTLLGGFIAYGQISPDMRARNRVEKVIRTIMVISSTVAILVTVGIVFSLLFETGRFFEKVPFFEFLFGLQWSPQIALRADQVASAGAFGAVPLFAGTLLITFIAMVVAVPVGLMSAIYMTQYANDRVRSMIKPVLEVLAGVPTVVYGFFAALVVAPEIRELGESIGLNVASESALAAGLVMGIMIIPFMSSLSDDALTAVPQSMRDGAYALGATKAETIRNVLIPAALPGIVGAFLLSVSRAVGETMIVVMAAGLAANLTANPLEAVTTVTVQIVTLLTGDQEFDSAKTLAAFALGLVLFTVTLALNVVALRVVQKYREQYE